MTLSNQALTTIASAKTYMGISDSSQDAMIEQLINSVSDDIANRCNRVFLLAERTEKLNGNGSSDLLLLHYPVTEITSVSIDTTVIDADEYSLDNGSGMLTRLGSAWPDGQKMTITYTAGYILPYQASSGATPVVPTLPYDLEMACIKMIAADINRKGSEHEKTEGLGPLQAAFLDNDYSESVLTILERYKRPVIV